MLWESTRRGRRPLADGSTAFQPMTTTVCFLATLLALLMIPLVVLAWFLETHPERARRWYRAGVSQREISRRLGCSRHRVKAWVTA